VLVGEQVAEDLGEGRYCFREVPAGSHDLIVYGDYGEDSRDELVISYTYSRLYMESMVDACIGTCLTTVSGKVTDSKGKPFANAEVCVDDLLIYINADKKGNYMLDLPPGEWTVRGQYFNQSGSGVVIAAEPVEGGDEKSKARLNLVLK
jgi:hypothetical protein